MPLRKKKQQKQKQKQKQTKSKATTKTKKDQSRRKSRQVGDSIVVIIQERRSGDSYEATYDEGTGGYFYTPKGRKTPVAYDERRHRIIKKTPEDGEGVDGDHYDTNPASDSDTNEEIEDPALGRRTRRVAVLKRSYVEKDSDDDDNQDFPPTANKRKESTPQKKKPLGKKKRSHEESDFEDTDVEETKPIGKKKESIDDAKNNMNKKAKTGKFTILDETDAVGNTKDTHEEPNLNRFSSPLGKTGWEIGDDWRTPSAIDY
eukprot:CAMPEP_0202475660 /NCGR_PEP_ID=MMETSP1360-20130828/93021_1 /ASSEMBLY_ACC=CAM_ASM_000848 /TAXON_ID=515479 /ORGANISM="Licmophora paradoxa, Strain CCMP2313" /LENGTH=259 /DNA_ID=CAMNT_0049102839 /DNA_START=218 /DNA_END=997 /DNA_ORIENTATION=+